MRTALGLLLLLFLSSPLAASERATGSFKDEFRNETRLHNLKKEDADVWRNEEGGDLRKYIPDDAKEDQNPQPKNSTTSQGSGRDMIISAVTSTSKAMLEVPKILTINSTTMTTLTSTTVMVVGVMRTSMIWKTLLDASLMTSKPHNNTLSTELIKETTQYSTAEEFPSSLPERTSSVFETWTTSNEMTSQETGASTMPSTAGILSEMTTREISTEGAGRSTTQAIATTLPETTSFPFLDTSITEAEGILKDTDTSSATWLPTTVPPLSSMPELSATTASWETTFGVTHDKMSTDLVSPMETHMSSSVGAASSSCNSETTQDSTLEEFPSTLPEHTSLFFETRTTPTERTSQETGAISTLPQSRTTTELPSTTEEETQPDLSTGLVSTGEARTSSSVGATSSFGNSVSTDMAEETTEESTVEDFLTTHPERTASSTLPLSRTTTELPSTAGFLSGISTPEISTEGAGGSTAQDFSTALPETTSSSFVARSTTAYESSTESNAASRTTWISSSAAPLSSTHVLPKTTESRDTTFGGMQPNMSTGLVSTMKAHTTPSEGPTTSSFFETSTTPPQSTLEATEASMTLSEIPSQATATGTLKGTEASTTTFLTPSAPPLSSTSELPKTTSSIAPLSSTHELLTISPSRDTTLNEILSETSTVIPSTVVVHTTLIGLRTTAATSPVSSTFPITSSHPSTSRNDTSFPSPASRSSTSVTTSAIPRPSRTTSKFSSASITMSDVSRISTTTSLVPSTFTIMSNVPIPSMTPSKVPSATTSAITTPSKSTPNDPNVFMTTSAVSSISTFMSGFFSTSVTTSMDLSSTTLTVPSISRSTFSSTSMATSTLPSSSATTSTVPSTFTTTSAVPRTLTTSTVPSSTTSTVPVSSMTTSTVPSISTTRSAHPSISMTSAASRTSMSTFAFPRSSTTTSTVPHTSRTTSAVPPATRTTSAPPSTPRTTVPATSKVPNTLTTTSTIPSTATLTTTAVLCYNGGFHDGVKCICPDNLFYGPKCEFPVPDFVPPEVPVAVRVEAQVRISNGEYTSALENPNSEDYQKLEKDFKSKMDEVYKDLLGYREVVILRLRWVPLFQTPASEDPSHSPKGQPAPYLPPACLALPLLSLLPGSREASAEVQGLRLRPFVALWSAQCSSWVQGSED